jgi:PAS domain S-box-containing protein
MNPNPSDGSDRPPAWPDGTPLVMATNAEFSQAAAMLKTFFNHSPLGILLADPTSGEMAINPAFQAMLGYTPEELRVIGVPGFTHPDDIAADFALFQKVLAGETDHYRLEKRFIRKDGSIMPATVTLFRTIDRDHPHVVAMIEDISERKAAEQALNEARAELEVRVQERTAELERVNAALSRSEERFRLAARAANDALYDYDVATGAIWWNEGLESVFGHAAGAPARQGIAWWTEQIHPEDRARVDAGLNAAIDRGESFWADEYRFRCADGGYIEVYDRGYFVMDDAGQVVRMLGAMIDLTERRRVEDLRAREQAAQAEVAAARQLDRLKTNFVNAISHELRTPLTSIKGYAEFLEDELQGPLNADQASFVREIEVGARRLEALIDDLLDFARIDAGTFTLHPRPFDLQDKVREVLSSLHPQAQKARVQLEPDLEPAPLVVEADPQRVGQVLFNLIGNAIKFTEDGGTIILRTRRTPDAVRCEVIDTGIGIAPEDQAKLFQRFSQLEAGAKVGGTGLGLSISKAIVEAHEGTIGVTSVPGGGSTFWFSLPAR